MGWVDVLLWSSVFEMVLGQNILSIFFEGICSERLQASAANPWGIMVLKTPQVLDPPSVCDKYYDEGQKSVYKIKQLFTIYNKTC